MQLLSGPCTGCSQRTGHALRGPPTAQSRGRVRACRVPGPAVAGGAAAGAAEGAAPTASKAGPAALLPGRGAVRLLQLGQLRGDGQRGLPRWLPSKGVREGLRTHGWGERWVGE